ncbi:MAG: hypothetical protein ACRCVN_04665 [Spirochaetia bacterium]
MKLEINGEEIVFELENEKKLIDVVKSIVGYLQSNAFVDLIFDADGKILEITDISWHELLVEDVQLLKVKGEMAYDFEQCMQILELTKEVFIAGTDEDLKKILGLWPRFVISLRFWLSDFHLGESYFNTIKNLPHLIAQVSDKPELKDQIIRMLELSMEAVKEKGRELENPKEEVLLAIDRLQNFKEPLTSLAVLFQNGKDGQAMQDILVFMELFQKLMRTVNFLPVQEYQAFREKTAAVAQSFSEKIREFTQACEDKDYVLAADVAEYEILPQLESLDELKKMLQA